jgi:ribosomal protein S8
MIYKILGIINRSWKEKKRIINIPYNINILKIIELLYKEGYIFSYFIKYNKIIVENNIGEGNIIGNSLKIYKIKKNTSYITNKKLYKMIKQNNKRYIMYTQYGILFGEQALKLKTGGCIISEII